MEICSCTISIHDITTHFEEVCGKHCHIKLSSCISLQSHQRMAGFMPFVTFTNKGFPGYHSTHQVSAKPPLYRYVVISGASHVVVWPPLLRLGDPVCFPAHCPIAVLVTAVYDWQQILQASQLPWREPSRGFNFKFPSFGKGVNIDKIAEDFKVPVHPFKPYKLLYCRVSCLLEGSCQGVFEVALTCSEVMARSCEYSVYM